MRRRTRVATAILATSLLVAALVACGSSDGSGATPEGGGGGSERPLAGVTLEPVIAGGEPLHFDDPGGLPIVVNLWATWCEPCRVEMPTFDDVADELAGRVRFVGVNVGDDADVAQRFVDETGVSFEQFLDPDLHVQTAVGAITMPSTAFLDSEGRLVHLQSGVMDRAALLARLESELDLTA